MGKTRLLPTDFITGVALAFKGHQQAFDEIQILDCLHFLRVLWTFPVPH